MYVRDAAGSRLEQIEEHSLSLSVCVCVCVCARERESVCKKESEGETFDTGKYMETNWILFR